MKIHLQHFGNVVRVLALTLLVGLVAACATGIVNHSFSFDTISDSPGITVLDYRYGNSAISLARADLSRERPRGGVNINGDMLRGDSLYVKWLVKATGKVYEDTVNLKALLPRNIEKHRIHFVVDGKQLFVYLITPDRRPDNLPPNGPRMYHYRKVITLSSSYGREVVNQ